jgi:hypothetical protein
MNKILLWDTSVCAWYRGFGLDKTSFTMETEIEYATRFDSKDQAVAWLTNATNCFDGDVILLEEVGKVEANLVDGPNPI